MACSNGTITVEELKKLLEEWNLVIGFLFLTWICLLQFAYANRNRFLYIIKLIFLWLLWPVTLTCFVLAAVYRINWITGGIAIAMACLVGLMWLSYFIASFRLFARTRSMWSFNPETNILLNVPLHGTILTRPLLESELVIGAVILRGHLRIAGHHLGRCDIKDLPKEITVATSRTLSYYKLGASQRVAGDSGFAAYSRYRIGNYKLNTDHSSSSDNIALLVQ
nr:membrane glycoprotein [Severe acute respiratory syndrome coronavirus 2]UJN83293.1 membrane glycoprotein [Severe acute respiratory syndrome coronavirus 2]UJS67460.1 membrane glycoprotein [Severe acute respiratory syndrome coronavirus 2]UKV59389.1 membrane glycoprotein [Severe acute respiratory syndrome coronavirus 2]ULE89421.1 membrane glycoprotein [Severe acute respiratory syndrome coronavirus 2]